MKKMILFLSLLVFANANNVEEFFYQKGYDAGMQKGYDLGVSVAMKEAKEVLKRYKDELKAYEIGKYLIRNKNLTYPQVFQELDKSGALKFRIIPSKIQKEFSIEDIFAKFTHIPKIKSTNADTLSLSVEEENSVVLPFRDVNYNSLTQNVNEQAKIKNLSVKKSAKNLEILKRANVLFSDEGNKYNIVFFTNQEKKDFCKSFQICN